MLLFLKKNQLTKFIIKILKEDEYYTEWKPTPAIGSPPIYEDYKLPDDKKGVAALSLYFLEELVNNPFLYLKHKTYLRNEKFIGIIKDLFLRKLEEYIYLNIEYKNNMLYLLNK